MRTSFRPPRSHPTGPGATGRRCQGRGLARSPWSAARPTRVRSRRCRRSPCRRWRTGDRRPRRAHAAARAPPARSAGRDLRRRPRRSLLLDLDGEVVHLLVGERAVLGRRLQPGDDLGPVPGLPVPGPFDHRQRHVLEALVGGVPTAARQALAAAADGGAVLGQSGVDHLVVERRAHRAPHRRPYRRAPGRLGRRRRRTATGRSGKPNCRRPAAVGRAPRGSACPRAAGCRRSARGAGRCPTACRPAARPRPGRRRPRCGRHRERRGVRSRSGPRLPAPTLRRRRGGRRRADRPPIAGPHAGVGAPRRGARVVAAGPQPPWDGRARRTSASEGWPSRGRSAAQGRRGGGATGRCAMLGGRADDEHGPLEAVRHRGGWRRPPGLRPTRRSAVLLLRDRC